MTIFYTQLYVITYTSTLLSATKQINKKINYYFYLHYASRQTIVYIYKQPTKQRNKMKKINVKFTIIVLLLLTIVLLTAKNSTTLVKRYEYKKTATLSKNKNFVIITTTRRLL